MIDAPVLSVVPDVVKPFRRHGLGYLYEPVDAAGDTIGVRIHADYLRKRADDVTAEVTIETTLPGQAGHVHQERLNLGAGRSKSGLAKELDGLVVLPAEIKWAQLIEAFCVAVLRAEREGGPFLRVDGRRPQSTRTTYLIDPLLIERKPTILYGPGAIGKGYVAVSACVAIASDDLDMAGMPTLHGPVSYLDWEDDYETFSARCWEVAAGYGLTEPPRRITYRRCRGTFASQLHQIAEHVASVQAVFVVVDSVGLASGSSGEHASYEDRALELFEALRYIETSVLLIDHVSEETRGSAGVVGKAYGSIYKMNLARHGWEARKDQDIGASVFHMGLYHVKPNHGPHLPPLGFSLDFSSAGSVVIRRSDPEASAALSARLPIQERMAALLKKQGPQAKRVLAEQLAVTEKDVQSAVVSTSRFITLSDGRIALGPTRRDMETLGLHIVEDHGEGDVPF